MRAGRKVQFEWQRNTLFQYVERKYDEEKTNNVNLAATEDEEKTNNDLDLLGPEFLDQL